MVEDYWGIRARPMTTDCGTYQMFVETSLWKARTLDDFEAHDWPTPDIFDHRVMADQCRRYPDHAILFEGSDLFTRPAILRGMDNLLLDMVDRPELAHCLLEKFTAFYCEDLARALEATHAGFQFCCEWSDFGTPKDLLISVPTWREFVAPYLKRLIDVCHSGGVKFMLHSCGAVQKLVPDFIALGVDVLDPIQVGAQGMVPSELHRDFGSQISFHGGIDIQSTLPFGTPDDVRREVAERVRILSPGGYIIAPTHNIQPDAPTENILAMYEVSLRGGAG